MKTALLRLLIPVAVALSAAFACADGFVIVPGHSVADPRQPAVMPPPHPVDAPLEVGDHNVAVKIEDQIAVTHVDQEFVNPTSARLEGY
jgi:hypothetical protein